VPNEIFQVAEIPRTLSGKKQELPIKKLLLGQPLEKVVNREAMANPGCLDWYVPLSSARPRSTVRASTWTPISRQLATRAVMCMAGWRASRRVSDTKPEVTLGYGPSATRIEPTSSPASRSTSRRRSSSSASQRLPRWMTSSPNTVGWNFPCPRSMSVTPSSTSSAWMLLVRAGCEMSSACAARPKCPCSARASRC
jgi:hypothetical protein